MANIGSGSNAAINVVNTPVNTGGASGGGGLLANQKDAKEASTETKFGDVWKDIQGKYGAKAEKPREIKKTLGKDDFLRIMITQMKHQDPTSPFKAEQFATEMAQFTSVEQLQNLNQSMAKMADANKPLERLAMTGMIGKTVTIDRERFPHTEGNNETLNFTLPKDAEKVELSLISAESGETVLTKDLGKLAAGANAFSWDGKKSNTLPAKGGNYMLRIDAKDDKDQAIPTNPLGQARVIGVSFEGQDAVFLVGDPARPDKVTMRNIVKIEDMGGGSTIPGAQPLAQAVAAVPQPKAGPNLFTFKKGQGSSNVEANALPPEAAQALAQYEQQQAVAAAAARGGDSNTAAAARGGETSDAVSKPVPMSDTSEGLAAASLGQGAAGSRTPYADGENGFANGLADGKNEPTSNAGGSRVQ